MAVPILGAVAVLTWWFGIGAALMALVVCGLWWARTWLQVSCLLVAIELDRRNRIDSLVQQVRHGSPSPGVSHGRPSPHR